jgi:hypothetical protein
MPFVKWPTHSVATCNHTSTHGAFQLYGLSKMSIRPSSFRSATLASWKPMPVAKTVFLELPFPSP